ncbi:MAG TPA: MATE family efflux transporter [Methylomusa anaerophila]|uniref:Probable multidrug resistance protein NorM n=1 Tax=Methylomusa anaerophila TaxID=1930071 RepID=A0A348AL93_9FIRM|nr:MATE family efflux transporter [Methylomusa anaerophila]BBB91841.1 multidrug resistance protein NorM [Methylomusa anaerophila]HML88426.1 MATE family efflux transporter [Methylomusa anaerophila]
MTELWKEESSVSFKRIIRITYPVLLSMLSFNAVVFVDRLYVAQYDLTQFAAMLPAGFSAIGLASIFTGIIGYVSVLAAQSYGAGHYRHCVAAMWQGIYLSLIFTLLLLLLSPLVSSVFQMMGHVGDLLTYEVEYFYLIIIAECIQLFSTAFFGFYCGIGDTKTTMYVALVTNMVNIVLAGVLVFGKLGMPALGMFGSGVAAIISCAVGLILYLFLLNRKVIKQQYRPLKYCQVNGRLLYSLLRFGLFAGIQSFLETGCFGIFLLIIGTTGETNLAAANVAFSMESVFILPVVGMTTAVGIIAGQERGANRFGNISEVLIKGLVLGICFNIIIFISYNFFPEILISVFHSDSSNDQNQLIHTATPLVRLASLWLVLDTVHLMIGSVLKSMGDTQFMMITYAVVPILFYVIIPYMFCTMAQVSLLWLWILLVGYSAVMLIVMTIRFWGGKWKSIEVIE